MKNKIFIILSIIVLALSSFVSCQKTDGFHYLDEQSSSQSSKTETYIINTKSLKIHKPSCGTGRRIYDENKEEYTGSLESLIEQGYSKCGNCFC